MRTGKVERVSEQRITCGKDFIQLSGEDASALGFNAHGGVGCISVTSNVAPRLCAEFQEATLAGDNDKALELQDRLMPLHKAIFIEPGVSGAKYALSQLGKVENVLRSPLVTVEAVDSREDRRRNEARRLDQLRRRRPPVRGMNQVRKADPNNKTVAENRKARFSYEVLDTFEAGLVLTGTEVKSLRQGQANIQDSLRVGRRRRDLADQLLSAGISAGQPLQP